MSTALITGASTGLGRAMARALAHAGWRLVINARSSSRLELVARELREVTEVNAVPGDVSDPAHRALLAAAAADLGAGLDLLVNNASSLGPSPLPPLAKLDASDLLRILVVNVEAPHALTQELLPALRRSHGIVLNVSSDAAVEHYEGWGGYGASKAALDHLTLTLAAELPELAAYAVDPGDMRTEMHQLAFPGEDIGDRPRPETVVPSLLTLIHRRPASGRYRACDFATGTEAPVLGRGLGA
ncbi:MAG: SDR family oxidoreductase [Actinomycetota bacterium]|nr:SDR family oxidoreductase [Actinomycetota bacterium]